MREEGIDFKQCSNAFLKCSHPHKLQQLADSLTAHDLSSCGQKWLACLTPFFKDSERKTCGCQHRLFFSQVEYCDNLIFGFFAYPRKKPQLEQIGVILRESPRSQGMTANLWDGKTLAEWLRRNWAVKLSVRQCQRLFRRHYLFGRQRPETRVETLSWYWRSLLMMTLVRQLT